MAASWNACGCPTDPSKAPNDPGTPMNAQTSRLRIDGPAGAIEVALDLPAAGAPRGLALMAHPHPLYGGTLDNKVTQTLARAWIQLGYACVRPNFRGVGETAGSFDEGVGETDDLVAVIDQTRADIARQAGVAPAELPIAIGGFSFGAAVAVRAAAQLQHRGDKLEHLTLVGTAVTRFPVPPVQGADTAKLAETALVLHGEEDDVVPLAAVLDWARPQQLPVVVVPGAGHFFHGMLMVLRDWVVRWHGASTPR